MHGYFHRKFSTEVSIVPVKSCPFLWETLWKLWETHPQRYTFMYIHGTHWIQHTAADVEKHALFSNAENKGVSKLYRDVLSDMGMEILALSVKENHL